MKEQNETLTAILTRRQKWLMENRIPQLTNALKEREGLLVNKSKALDVFCAADPSHNNSAVQWLIEAYLRDGFLFEDIAAGKDSKVFETLELFVRYRKHLDQDQRSLYGYRTLGALYQSIEAFDLNDQTNAQLGLTDDPAGRALKRLEKQRAQNESNILLNNLDLKIIIPLTKFAAQWLGRGTRWCTSAEKNNYFDQYNQTAPLIIFIVNNNLLKKNESDLEFYSDSIQNRYQTHTQTYNKKTQTKFQLWVTPDQIQFMNEQDQSVDYNFVKENWSIFGPIVLWAMETNVGLLSLVPKQLIGEQLALDCVDKSFSSLSYIPDEFLTDELIKNCLKKNGLSLRWIPNKLINEEYVKLAIEQSPEAISWVPEKLITKEISDLVIEKYSNIALYIPYKFWTTEIYKKIVQNDWSRISLVKNKDWPNHLLTEEICQLAVDKSWRAIEYIPSDRITSDIINSALEQTSGAFELIPKHLLTEEICLNTVKKKKWFALSNVPNHLLTYDICLTSIGCAYRNIASVPKDMLTEEICLAHVRNYKDLYLIPEHIYSDNIMQELVKTNGNKITSVPENFKTYELCKQAVQQTGSSLQEIKSEFRTEELCLIAVKDYAPAIEWIEDEQRTAEMYQAVLKQIDSYPKLIEQVPAQYLTEEFCMQAISSWEAKDTSSLILSVPEKFYTNELLIQAVRTNAYSVHFIPEKYHWDGLYMEALEQNPVVQDFIPNEHRQRIIDVFNKKSGYDRIAQKQARIDHLQEKLNQEQKDYQNTSKIEWKLDDVLKTIQPFVDDYDIKNDKLENNKVENNKTFNV